MTLEEPLAKALAGGSDPTNRELYDLGCGLTLGRYTLLRRIATGGMAEVYAARARGIAGFERKVAIKKILPQLAHNDRFIDMLVDEAKITVHLTHSSIAQVYELGLEGEETYFIVMEYVEGRPLSRVMQRLEERGETCVPVAQAAHIMAEVAHGLEHAHRCTDARGQPLAIVHRDITPQNVLISYGGEVKLIDFGIARAEGRIALTHDGVIKGKLRYLAPEIALGNDPDHRADLYNCGIVLFEMLTGEALFSPRSDLEAIQMASEARVRSPRSRNPNVPEALDEIVMRALRREASERYQSAKELAADLERFLARAFPSFARGELGDLMSSIYRDEIAADRRMDARAEQFLLDGRDAMNAATAVAQAPDVADKGYRPLVTRLHGPAADAPPAKASRSGPLARDPAHRMNVVGADGGEPMQIVLADSSVSARPSASARPGPNAAESTVARPRGPAPSGRPERSTSRPEPGRVAKPRGRPGDSQSDDGASRRPLGFATIDARSPARTSVSDEIVSAMPTIMRMASDARGRARGADDDSDDGAAGENEATLLGDDGQLQPFDGLEDTNEATHASSAVPAGWAADGLEPQVDGAGAEEPTHRAISSPDEGNLRVLPRTASVGDRSPLRRGSSPRGLSRARPRSSGSFPSLKSLDAVDPADKPAPNAIVEVRRAPDPDEEAGERTLSTPPPEPPPSGPARARGARSETFRGSSRREAVPMSRAKALWENPMGDVLVAVAIFIVVACCLVLALGRGPAPTPAAQVPAAQVPAAQVPAAQVPAAQVPAAQVPAAQVPAAPPEIPATPPSEIPATPSEIPATPSVIPAKEPPDTDEAALQDVEDEDADGRSPTRRWLYVNSWPAGSAVTVDGKKRGFTNLKLKLAAGKHKVSLKSERGEIVTFTCNLETEKKCMIRHQWKK